jgi:hypothetical protein
VQVVVSILSHLGPRDLLCVALVNTFFASMCADGLVWSAVYDRTWPLSLCFTSPWHTANTPPQLASTSTSLTITSSDGDRQERAVNSTVSWKRVVQQRAETERNWEAGAYRVLHEFTAITPLSDMAMNRCRSSRARAIVAFSTYSDKVHHHSIFSSMLWHSCRSSLTWLSRGRLFCTTWTQARSWYDSLPHACTYRLLCVS